MLNTNLILPRTACYEYISCFLYFKRARYASRYSLYTCTRAFGHMLLTISYSESTYPITPVEPLKPRFWDNSEICLLLVVNNNKYLSYIVDNIIFGISVPDYPSRTVETTFLGQF